MLTFIVGVAGLMPLLGFLILVLLPILKKPDIEY